MRHVNAEACAGQTPAREGWLPRFARLSLIGIMLLGTCRVHGAVNPLGLRVHHATASVGDIDRAVRWYHDFLGFRVVKRGSREHGNFQFAELRINGFGIGLVQLSRETSAAPAAAVNSAGWQHIVFSVAKPDEAFAWLQQKGADVFTRPPDAKRPISSFLVRDSEGNEIEIVGR